MEPKSQKTPSDEQQRAHQFAQIEFAIGNYYDTYLKSWVNNHLIQLEQEKLEHIKQVTQTAGYAAAGMYGGATAQSAMLNTQLKMYDTPQSVEEVRDSCFAHLLKQETIREDLATLTNSWRTTFILEYGEARYNELSEQVPGKDLASAYISKCFTQHFCAQLADKEVPRSTLEYVLYKGFSSSFLCSMVKQYGGGEQGLDAEVKKLAEAQYAPSKVEQAIGSVVGLGIDLFASAALSVGAAPAVAVSSTAMHTATSLSTKALSILALDVLNHSLNSAEEKQWSQAIYADETLSSQIAEASTHLDAKAIPLVRVINQGLKQPLNLETYEIPYDQSQVDAITNHLCTQARQSGSKLEAQLTTLYQQAGITIQPAGSPSHVEEGLSEAAYYRSAAELTSRVLEAKAHYRTTVHYDGETLSVEQAAGRSLYYAQCARIKETERINKEMEKEQTASSQANQEQEQKGRIPSSQAQPDKKQNQLFGWDTLLDQIGLKGFGDIGHNLGYVLAMLPNMMVNLFMGRTKLKIQDNLWPIAAIILGLFTKNPLLRMILIGFGGANLLNKITHDQVGDRISRPSRYKVYPDEPLNGRIKELAVKGNTLMATIDGNPCVLTISDRAMDAYYKGALPLNTLANALLPHYDDHQYQLQKGYEREIHEQEHEDLAMSIR